MIFPKSFPSLCICSEKSSRSDRSNSWMALTISWPYLKAWGHSLVNLLVIAEKVHSSLFWQWEKSSLKVSPKLQPVKPVKMEVPSPMSLAMLEKSPAKMVCRKSWVNLAVSYVKQSSGVFSKPRPSMKP